MLHDPWNRDGKKSGTGSGMNIPDYFPEEFFGLKIIKYADKHPVPPNTDINCCNVHYRKSIFLPLN